MAGVPTNTTNIDLPVEVSQEIIQKVQEASAVMRLARQTELSGRGEAIPVILGDVEADWVAETGKKPVSNPNLTTKILRPYELAVIVPFSNKFKRDAERLYEELVRRIPGALSAKFDGTVFGAYEKPGDDFDTLASVTVQSIASDAYGGLVAADTDISLHGGIVNGYAISPQARGLLLASKDEQGRPLFVNNVAEGAIPMILGARTHMTKGAFVNGTPKKVAFAGDWNQALWGTVEGVKISISDQATLDLGNGQSINLFQQNMFAIRAEIEVGFRADTSVFNALTATDVPSI